FLALLQRLEIARERFFGAERFPRPIRFDWSIVNPSAEVEEFAAEFPEKIDKFGAGETLKLSARFDPEVLQSPLGFFTDTPDFARRQILHESRHLVRGDFQLSVRLPHRAGDFCDQLVWPDAGGRSQFRLLEN